VQIAKALGADLDPSVGSLMGRPFACDSSFVRSRYRSGRGRGGEGMQERP
jgi:hypothetical protein